MTTKQLSVAIGASLALLVPSAAFSQTLAFADGQALPRGLSELTYDASNQSVSGSFAHKGTRIVIETRRGPATPRELRRNNPDAPRYEIDIKLSDETGRVFFVQVGGDSPIDSTWSVGDEGAAQDLAEGADERTYAALSGAVKMVDSLARLRARPGLAPEFKAIKDILPLLQEALVPGGIEGNDVNWAPSTYQHYIEIWRAYMTPLPGNHSATLVKVKSSNGATTHYTLSSCNHGACAGGRGMSKACSKTFTGRGFLIGTMPNCSTPYGLKPGQHVCNDDAYIQYYRIKYDTPADTRGGTCSDWVVRFYGPTCW